MTHQQMHEHLVSARKHINEALGDLNIIACGDAEHPKSYYQHAARNTSIAEAQVHVVDEELQRRLDAYEG